MKKVLLVFITTIAMLQVFSQHSVVQGIVADTSNKQTIPNAVISILRAKDSVLLRFTRSNSQGKFSLSAVPSGDIIVLITYPKYADYVEKLTLKDSSAINMQKIPLILKAKLLEEVVIHKKIAAIKINGDTTEFTADSFHVQANATVEDLLKKLPGIQVDKNGKITAQGEAVQKVLVDGEEFFGDDPTLVTQNLRADMVDKVQVFDKKSDQAAFTGIDDGQKSKTINLKLKDSKKNGYFGRVNLGAGTNGYYDNQAMLNLFKKKRKLSAYGIVSNTGKTGLDWSEQNTYGDNIANSIDVDQASGNIMFTGSQDELDSWDGRYNGQGYPKVKSGGVHYNDKWDDDKQALNFNYKMLQLNVHGENGTNTEYILPDTVYYNNQTEKFSNLIMRNRANGSYELQFDSTSSIKISANGGTDHKETDSYFTTEARAADSTLVNNGNRHITTDGDTRMVNSNILWRKKLQKKGRTVSVNISENFQNNSSDGFLLANNYFYKGGLPADQQVTDQYKKYKTEKLTVYSKITYSEPLSPSSSIIANYGIDIANTSSNRQSFNKGAGGKYTDLDSVYSNNYRFNIFTHSAGLVYNVIKKKIRFNAGSNIGITSFRQEDLLLDTVQHRNFINWFPQASFIYQFNTQKRIALRYNGNTTQPSMQQLQPTRTNDDPLNVTIGNPALKPQFTNSLNLNFNEYKVLSETSVYMGINYRFMENSLVNSSNVDSAGKRTNQAVNLNGASSLSGYLSYGFKWKKPAINIGFNGQVNQSRNPGIVNGLLNLTNSLNYGLSTYLYKGKDKKYELRLEAGANYTLSTSSIQSQVKTKYWTYNLQPAFDVYLPLKFQVHSDADCNFRQKTTAFDFNTNVVLWNAWVGKKFMKNESLLIKVVGNDLLNRNIGFNRQVTSNFVSQNTYSTIQRFFMLSIVWNFNKAGTPAPNN